MLNQGNDRQYRAKLQWSEIDWRGLQAPMMMYHYANGPRLRVTGRAFQPTSPEQTTLWSKSKTGWVAQQTESWGMFQPPTPQELQTYVASCVSHCAFYENHLGSVSLEFHDGLGLGDDAMKLWAANSLLLKNWQAENFPLVNDINNSNLGLRPAPRVMQNGLDLQLEAYVAQLEGNLLQRINRTLHGRGTTDSWGELCAATFVLLAVMEKDIWRLVYWVRHRQEVGNIPSFNGFTM